MKHEELIGRLAPVTDEEAARMVSPGTRSDLADRITSTAVPEERPARRRRTLVIGLPLAGAAVAASVVAASVLSGSPAPRRQTPQTTRSGAPRVQLAALTFSTQGRYLIVKVKDPLADPARYRKEFAAHGMNIDLRLVPVSPSIVGTVVMSESEGDAIKVITARGRCRTGGGGDCPVGLKIPLDYKAHSMEVFGRAARPGEQYSSTAPADAPGEVMHGLTYRGRTVAEVLAMLKKRHVTVPQYRYVAANGDNRPYQYGVPPAKVKPGWFVHDADPWAQGQVMLWVGPTRQVHEGPPSPGAPVPTPTAH
ncbi:hypothetical protein [Actinoallomurus rhizosphaericola]|uniref:hypothetical protein n=1 Tax=Actinoallomurus rhizosphaericola TaxID=2952536 RepID=UPI0020903310|nr:hypothetical protein [Actinoallomurus rhizosphaericola]MCO5991955.1 hypothetical protein [Actinoallomurus rhizosphaericola]